MSTFEQNAADFKAINTAVLDLFKDTSRQWSEMINRSFANSDEAKQSGLTWLIADVRKLWPKEIFSVNIHSDQWKKILAANLEQQKLCSNLTTSWFTCVAKMMEALRTGAQNQNNPAETIKLCKDLAAGYRRSCADFIESECAQICDALRSQEANAAKSEKVETVKAKAKAKN
jgi:hypothetical protein